MKNGIPLVIKAGRAEGRWLMNSTNGKGTTNQPQDHTCKLLYDQPQNKDDLKANIKVKNWQTESSWQGSSGAFDSLISSDNNSTTSDFVGEQKHTSSLTKILPVVKGATSVSMKSKDKKSKKAALKVKRKFNEVADITYVVHPNDNMKTLGGRDSICQLLIQEYQELAKLGIDSPDSEDLWVLDCKLSLSKLQEVPDVDLMGLFHDAKRYRAVCKKRSKIKKSKLAWHTGGMD